MNWEKRLALNDIQPDSISYNLIYVDPFEEREKKKKEMKILSQSRLAWI